MASRCIRSGSCTVPRHRAVPLSASISNSPWIRRARSGKKHQRRASATWCSFQNLEQNWSLRRCRQCQVGLAHPVSLSIHLHFHLHISNTHFLSLQRISDARGHRVCAKGGARPSSPSEYTMLQHTTHHTTQPSKAALGRSKLGQTQPKQPIPDYPRPTHQTTPCKRVVSSMVWQLSEVP